MKQLTQSNYKSDKLYPSVVRAVDAILERSLFVAPIDVLIASDRLDKKLYEDWRFGRIPYLERVTKSGLGNLNRILRIVQLHCEALGLKPSHTVYNRWGKGPKTRLRFSKSGDANLEAAYSTHWVAQKLVVRRSASLHQQNHDAERRATKDVVSPQTPSVVHAPS